LASDPAPGAVPAHVRRRRRTVLAATFLGLAAAGAWSLVAPKVYVAEARLEATARRPAAEGAHDAVDNLRGRILSPETITQATGRDGAGAPDSRDTAAVTLATQVEVESRGGAGATLCVTHSAPDPDLALRTLQGLLEQFRADLYEAPRRRQEAAVADARRSWEEADAAAGAAEQARDAHREANRDYLDDLDAQIASVRREVEEVEQGEVVRLGEKMQEAEQVLAVEPQYRREEIREIDQVALAGVENEMQRHRALIKDL